MSKCKLCKTENKKENMYQVKARTYVCSQEEWEAHLHEEKMKEDFMKVMNYLVRDLEDCTNANFGLRANSVAKRLYNKYSFEVLKLTLDKTCEDMVKYIHKNNIGSIEGRFLYCLKILENQVGFGLMEKKRLDDEKARRLNAVNTKEEEVEEDTFRKRKKKAPKKVVNNDLLDEFFK